MFKIRKFCLNCENELCLYMKVSDIQKYKWEYIKSGILPLSKKGKFIKLTQDSIKPTNVVELYNTVLFVLAHATKPSDYEWAISHLKIIIKWCKANPKLPKLDNSGLPCTNIYSYYSYTMLGWLVATKFKISIEDIHSEKYTLQQLLQNSLPRFQQDACSIANTNGELLEILKVSEPEVLSFVLDQMRAIEFPMAYKENLFSQLEIVFLISLDEKWHRASNKLSFVDYYYQCEWIKKIDIEKWITLSIPKHKELTTLQKQEIEFTSKCKLALLQRETDPVTYMDRNSIRYYELEHGISIGLFTMVEEKQMSYESYVGYTLYKNGFPAAYGGAWIFGGRALIGINIFEWCRGGESSLFFTQILRVYSQVFDISQFEVEPYQYGKDNPEGIQSGAFWFYYRLGFAPIDIKLKKLAALEFKRMSKDKNYRSPEKYLLKFTESNVRMKLNDTSIISILNTKNLVSNWIRKCFKSNRNEAIIFSKKKFESLGLFQNGNASRNQMDVCLLFSALNMEPDHNDEVLVALLKCDSSDPYLYQLLLKQILKRGKK